MIRASTFLWIGLAGAVGVGTYQLKHRVQALEDDLFRLNRQIVAEQDAIHVLRAEWAYINQPQRLEALAQRHLAMQAMVPTQMGQVADLPRRPPPPATPPAPVIAAAPATAAPAPAAPAAPSARSASARPVAEPRPAPHAARAAEPAQTPEPAPAAEPRPAAERRPAAAPTRAAPRPDREPSIADLLAVMRPPPAERAGDPYAGGGPASGAGRMPAAQAPARGNVALTGAPTPRSE